MTLVTQPMAGMEKGEARQATKETEQRQRESNAGETTPSSKEESAKEGGASKERKRRKSSRKITLEPSSDGGIDVPAVTLEMATPSPLPPTEPRQADENNNEEEPEDDDYEEEGEEEEAEEEEVETEMTPEEKKAMHDAVKSGDIDLLEDCLDKPNSDINMIWYRENLLMAAIKSGQQEMAEFLLDNGIDHTFKTSIVALRDTSKGKILDRYEISCRQIAYDFGMLDIVELIDLLQGKLFSFIKPTERTPRYRRPKPTTPTESEDSSSSGSDPSDSSSSSGSESDSEGSGSVSLRLKSKKLRKKSITKKSDIVDGADDVVKNENDAASIGGLSTPDLRRKSEESEDLATKKKEKRKKSKNNKKRKRKGTVSDAPEGEEGETNKTGTGSFLDADSGHHSMGSSKLKIAMLKEHDKMSEQEEHTAPSSEGGLCPPNQTVEEKSYKDAAQSQSEKSEAEGSHAHDEGYGTVSLKSPTPCPSPEVKPSWAMEPMNFIRSTKSSLSIRRIHGHRPLHPGLMYSDVQDSLQDSPLKWRKVSTVGSYAKESKQWHVTTSNIAQPSVEISEIKLSPPSTAQSSTASTSALSSSLPKSILKSSISSASTIVSESISQRETNSQNKQKGKPETPIASYMRPTKSSLTKKRLSPTFVTSYGALDFQYLPETRSSQYFVYGSNSTSSSNFRSRTSSSLSSKSLAMPYLSHTTPKKRFHSSQIISS